MRTKDSGKISALVLIRHCGPFGDAASSPESFLCPWRPHWVRLDRIFVTKTRLNQVKDHRLHGGSGGAHRKTLPVPPRMPMIHNWLHIWRSTKYQVLRYPGPNLHQSNPGMVQLQTTPSESDKDQVDLVRIQDESWWMLPISIWICISVQTISSWSICDLGVYLFISMKYNLSHHHWYGSDVVITIIIILQCSLSLSSSSCHCFHCQHSLLLSAAIILVRRRKFNFRWRGPPDSSISSLILVGWCEEGHPATKTCSNFPRDR